MTESSFIEDYFEETTECFSKFSNKTIVFMQNGLFYELYGYKQNIEGEMEGSHIEAISALCGLTVSQKKGTYLKFPNSIIYMTGIRDYLIESVISTITNEGYTMAIYIQKNDITKSKKRILDKVYSPGTFLSTNTNDVQKTSNYIMCVWLHTYNNMSGKQFIYGISAINILTGDSFLLEKTTIFELTPSTFDEIERILSVYNPSECIFISPFEENIMNIILQYINYKNKNPPYILSTQSVISKKCTTQTYINYLLSLYYGEDTFNTVPEFSTNIIATQSFTYLLYFIRERNPNVIHNIQLPYFLNNIKHLQLANHSLSQLNIIEQSNMDNKEYSSVVKLFNKCVTVMGKRELYNQLTNPTFDVEWLEKEYNMIEYLLNDDNVDMIIPLRKILKDIPDLNKIVRQIIIGDIYPHTFYQLNESLNKIKQLHECIQLLNPLYTYINPTYTYSECTRQIIDLMNIITTKLHISNCRSVQKNITKWIIQPLYSTELDNKTTKYNLYKNEFTILFDYFNKCMQLMLNTDKEICKEIYTDTSGYSIQLTLTRSNSIKPILQSFSEKYSVNKSIEINDKIVYIKDITFHTLNKTTVEIKHPILDKIIEDLLLLNNEIFELSTTLYENIIKEVQTTQIINLKSIAHFIQLFDVILNKSYISNKYNYSKPIIDHTTTNSYVDIKQLRHALSEHIQQNELYVANDISVGFQEKGILIYGTNAVGKTCLIKSLGIAVIAAQSGMYVPCTYMKYVPYQSIMTRIVGNDNIHKGLSTFAVEMIELRTILRYATENSLILGDELCSGTEQESANSIFVAGLQHLFRMKTSFLFATHLHDIVHFDEIKNMYPVLVCKHLSVTYDRELDCLIYDRILKDGSGDRMYGLEVCKSLHLPNQFLDEAFQIRNKYYGNISDKQTVYNSKKIRGMCEICGEKPASEIHHFQEQHKADKNGYIGTIHKNHPANLASICNDCHNKEHASENTSTKTIRKKTTSGKIIISK